MALVHAKNRTWTLTEYQHLGDVGTFQPDEKIELIEGNIVSMTPQNGPHRMAIIRGGDVLFGALRDTHYVGVQVPINIPPLSSPEPDFIVLPRDQVRVNDISTVELIVEVADTSLEYDRDEKASLYAKSGVRDYWIVNLRHRRLEVHRDPVSMMDRPFGFGYRSVTLLSEEEFVSPLCRPDVSIGVSDLLD